ncbi:hypothetical protein SBY92_003252 [Candida maltosa Xu316]|uniref:HRQ family protein n=1 Tax=Candida maltosa (strain Xu316) TaxID=1245528 RepID=M3HLN1_CANMX|nr:hypothetical protein G210_1102 [Candida maltosa Xu316]
MATNTTDFFDLLSTYSNNNSNVQTIGITVLLIVIASYFYVKKVINKPNQPAKQQSPPASKLYDTSYQPLKPSPVTDFQWDKVEPLKSYPFKNGEYKLTMGIRTLDPQDWLLIEPTYKSRIAHKEKIISNSHPDYPADKDTRSATIFSTPECVPAIIEFYEMVMQYMCDKYPTCFQKENDTIHNLITGKSYPTTGTDPIKLEEYLVENIEEDFIILLKDPTREDEENGTEYFFKGGVFAFAAGFNPSDRFNKPLTFIHHPIPGYETKLKTSMNRFFNRLSPGSFITRSNFSMQTHNKFYVDDANKGHNLPEGYVQEPLKYEDLDFENQVHYRSERQVLTKLPKSGAIVFTIRTYLLPLADVKREGKEVRERLIGAIRGLPKDISQYKRGDEWGPAVIQFLSEP